MSSLVVYSSSSSSDENNDYYSYGSSGANKFESITRLPAATTLLGTSKNQTNEDDISLNDPDLHEGRQRSFPHVRGNWPTFVYIPVSCAALENFREKCRNDLQDFADLRPTENLHISLSRTVVLRHHHIDVFVESLNKQLKNCKSFSVQLQGLKVYTNDDKTRTFIACKVDEIFDEPLHTLIHIVNDLMTEFKMPVFYEEASFHVSILWCLGDHLNALQSKLNAKSLADIEPNNSSLSINVTKILCGIGNKTFTFQLME